MKKLFFRWKDENCNGINTEWVEMTGKEFLEFKRKPENKHRKFIANVDEYKELPTIVMEATQEMYDEWHREEERKRRKKEDEKKRGYKLVSMDAEIQSSEIEDLTLHDVIPDESVNVEEDVSNNCMVHNLKEILKELSNEEMDLITKLYLSSNPLTVRAYAEQIGMSHVAVLKRKKAVFEKIKKFF